MPRLYPWLLAAVVAIGVYAVTIHGTYIFDDQFFVHNDPRLASVDRWEQFWTQAYYPTSQDRLYRPLTSMSYAIEWVLFGNQPWIFHLINILLYAGVCAGIAILAERLGGMRFAYFAGLLFAVHPVHVEAVAYLVGRAELLCTGCMVWAMVLFLPRSRNGFSPSPGTPGEGRGGGNLKSKIRNPKSENPPTLTLPRSTRGGDRMTGKKIVGITVLLVLALLCKEQAIVLPVLLGALVPLHLWHGRDERDNRRAKIILVIIFWTVAAYVIIREYSPMKFSFDPSLLDWTMQPLIRAKGINRWLIPFTILGRYAMLLVVPFRQAIDYGYAVISYIQRLNDPYLWIGFATAIAGLLALAISLWKRAWLPAWCLIGLGVSYGIISNFPSIIGTIMGERLMFLPSVFYVLLLAWLILKLPRRAGVGILVILVLLGGVRTVIYARQWDSRLHFYQLQARTNPESVRTWWLLGQELDRRHEYSAALKATNQMQQIAPDYWISWAFAGEISMHAGQYHQALAYLQRAWECKPTGHLEIDFLRTQVEEKMKPTTRGAH